MAITGLRAAPAVTLAGKAVKLYPIGSSAGPNNSQRYYIATAPAASSLLTLANRAARYKKLADCRLDLNNSGATFTPDVVGLYEITMVDVTATYFVPHFDDDHGADSDNELTGAPSYTIPVRAVESTAFTIGSPPDTATLTLYTYADQMLTANEGSELGTAPVTLVPSASSASAKVAAYSEDVLAVLDDIAATTGPSAKLALHFLIGFGPLYIQADGTNDIAVETVTGIAALWNSHCAQDSTFTTHVAADGTNPIVAANASNLATACTLLNAARTAYEAHRILAGSVHTSADTLPAHIIDPTLPAASTLDTAADLWLEIWTKLGRHGTDTFAHGTSPSSPVDGSLRQQVERPGTLLHLVNRTNDLKALFNGHVGRTSNTAGHGTADADNVVTAANSVSTLEGAAKLICAVADGIDRHSQNLKADGTAAASPYHVKSSVTVTDPSAKVKSRASAQNPQSILDTAADCLRVMQAHSLNLQVHGSKVWGRFGSDAWPLYARLALAWAKAVQTSGPIPSANSNSFANIVKLTYGAK